MTHALLLNASYEALTVLPLKRAIVLVIDGKAEVVEESDEPFRAARVTMNKPLVIRLKYFVKVPFRAQLPLTRKNLRARDNDTCAYCRKRPDRGTIDHVQPRSKGGKHEWTNVVWACGPCNERKGDSLLSELGWKLPFKLTAPRSIVWLTVGLGEVESAWEPYLQPAA